MSPRLFGRLGEDVGFSVPPLASAACPPRPAAPPACPPRAPAAPPPALAGCAAALLSGCAGRRPPSVRENMRFLATKPSSGTPNAPLRPKRALLPGESPGRRNRQSRCAVGSGPIRARTRFGGQKSRARGHEGALGRGVLEAIARGGRRCGRGGMRRALRGCGAPCGGGGRATRLAAPRERPVRRRNHADAKGQGNARGVGVKARARSCASVAAVGGRRRCDRADRALLHACSKFLLAENCMEGGPACP